MNMKKITVLIFLVYGLAQAGHTQVKITKATSQKVTAGMGGTFMNYQVGLRHKKADSLVVDSIRTIADKKDLRFYYNKTERAYAEIAFGYALEKPAKCKVCPDVVPNQSNLTKGVIVYYRIGAKNLKKKVKKFKQLEDKITP